MGTGDHFIKKRPSWSMEIIDMLLYGNGFTNLFFGCLGCMFTELYKEYKEGETEIEKLNKLLKERDNKARLSTGLPPRS